MTTFHQPMYEHFNPRQYLETYYANLPPENMAMLEFLVAAFANVPNDALALDFGTGPMLYTAIAGARRVREMHLAEYLPANRAELKRWLSGKPDAFDWSNAIRAVLELSGQDSHDAAIHAHANLMRARVSDVMACDLMADIPLENPTLAGTYDVLVSSLCAEAVAQDIPTWNTYLSKFAALLKPGGRIILIAVKQSHAYSVGKHHFPVLPLTEEDVSNGLKNAGFVQEFPLGHAEANDPIHPYEGLIFATARKL